MASQGGNRQPEGNPKLKAPEGNEAIAQKARGARAAAPLATISSHADPWPHYLMSGACAGAAWHSYSTLNNPRAAGIKLAFGAAYLWAGRMLVNGNPTLGYDLGTITSLGLLAFTGASSAFSKLLPVSSLGPRAYATSETASTVMASLGGISSVTNLIKSYQQRTGKPKEIGYTRE